MAQHTQTIRRQFADELLSVFGHFLGLALKGLRIDLDFGSRSEPLPSNMVVGNGHEASSNLKTFLIFSA